jgi:hypothetical protein
MLCDTIVELGLRFSRQTHKPLIKVKRATCFYGASASYGIAELTRGMRKAKF